METIIVEKCPETGICSLVKGGGNKTDLMPFEVDELKKLSVDDVEKIREVIGQGNEAFAKSLSPEEIKRIYSQIS